MSPASLVLLLLGLLLGLVAGVLAGLRLGGRRGAVDLAVLEERDRRLVEATEARLRQTALALQARGDGDAEARRVAVEGLVAPLRDTLGRVEGHLRELERARIDSCARLTEQVDAVRVTGEQLRRETGALVTALRAPQTRGRWGELQLRRVVEMAGMVEHCDFDEQASVRGDDGLLRPDLVVRLAGGRSVVVDSKVSLAAYLEAAETQDPDVRAQRLAAHARHLRKHVDDLAGKAYWAQFAASPEFVVLFVPGEAFLAPALEADPTLLEHAMGKRVIVATPTTLMSLLRTVAYAWQQEALTENAREVFALGRELYDRLSTLGRHVDKLGRSVGRVVADYNTAVGSLEGRVLVSARRLKDLKVVEAELERPRPVEEAPRPLGAPELVQDRDDRDETTIEEEPDLAPRGDGLAEHVAQVERMAGTDVGGQQETARTA
ncbi:MAG: DNA recombination protein RmuC [Motilibacteraceae bacterium]